MALELSPSIKYEFNNLTHYLGLDKPTQMRSYYLFEEFLKKTPKNIKKETYSVYFRVSCFVACKSMKLKNKEGKQL